MCTTEYTLFTRLYHVHSHLLLTIVFLCSFTSDLLNAHSVTCLLSLLFSGNSCFMTSSRHYCSNLLSIVTQSKAHINLFVQRAVIFTLAKFPQLSHEGALFSHSTCYFFLFLSSVSCESSGASCFSRRTAIFTKQGYAHSQEGKINYLFQARCAMR